MLGWWGGLEGLDLLLEILVFFDELREALLDLVDEFVNFQDLIAGLARHPEPLVADVVECQRHRAPRVSRWNFRWGRAPHPPYRTQFGLGAQPSEYDGEKS